MDFLNIHTHHQLPEGETTIRSFGLHPWYLNEDWQERFKNETLKVESQIDERLRDERATTDEPLFIGECGLDRVCDTPYDRQLAAFEAHVDLSERLSLPLILHCVRALDDALRMKRGTRQPWVFHGFRGKPQQLRQLLDHDFYVSFGFHFNEESLKLCPADHLFLETDDAPHSIVPLYESVARLRHISVEELRQQVWTNLTAVACHSDDDSSLRAL